MQNDIMVVLDAGHSTARLLLDLSASIDITDHDILINFFAILVCISPTALNLLSSFLSDRFQSAIASYSKSQPALLE